MNVTKMEEYYKHILGEFKDKEAKSFPFVTLYINLRKTPGNYDKARIFVKDFFKKLKEGEISFDGVYGVEDRKIVRRLLEYENEILSWLEANYRESKNGVMFLFGGDEDSFEVLEFSSPTPSIYFVGNKPALSILAYQIENLEPSLVFLVDSRETRTLISVLEDVEEVFDVKDEHWPLIEAKARMDTEDKDILHGVYSRYVSDIAEKIKGIQDKLHFAKILIYAPEKLASLFREKLAGKKNIFVFTKNLLKANKNHIKDTVVRDVAEIERKQDEEELKELLSQIGEADYKRGVAGIDAVLEHLNAGAVQKLFIDEDFAFPSIYKNEETGLLNLMNDDGGKEVLDIVNEIVLATIRQKGSVNFVSGNDEFSKMGIAALVRFKVGE